MSALYYLEIISRNGEVQSRHAFNELPIRIGRAYDNQLILEDPHTAPHHAQIEANENGELIVHDLNTHNGIVYKRQRVQNLALDGNTIVRLGHTNLRVRRNDFQVSPELVDSTNHHWEGWLPAIVGLLLITAQTLFSLWMSQTSKLEPLDYLTQVATLLIAILLWGGLWALANRLFSGHTRFGRHLFIAACGMLAAETWSLIGGYLAYAFSLEFFTRYDTHINYVIAIAMLYFHLTTVAPRYKKRLRIITLLLALGAAGWSLINSHQNTGVLSDELYMHELLPPSLRQSPNSSIDEFIDRASKMKPVLEAAQKEKVDITDSNKKEDEKNGEPENDFE